METMFVNLKSELTLQKKAFEAVGMACYRTRLQCNCEPCFNRRDGVLVISSSNELVVKVIKCKNCKKGGRL